MTVAHEDRLAAFSTPRVALWSAFAGFMIPFVGILAVNTAFGWWGMPSIAPTIAGIAGAVLSAGSAATTLTIAKRALPGSTQAPHNLSATLQDGLFPLDRTLIRFHFPGSIKCQ